MEFILTNYNKILSYITMKWISIVDSVQAFDFGMLFKVGFILLIGYFLAKLFSKHIPKAIQSIGDKFNIEVSKELIQAFRSFIFKLILFSFVLIAINIIDLPKSIDFISNAIVKSILFITFISFALNIVKINLYRMAYANKKDDDSENVRVVQESTLPLFENTALIIFALAGIYQVFSIWNVDMTALLAGAGIGAMAIGMAAKDTLSDIIAGILILTDSPYRVGDVVYVKDNLKGRVSQIGLRNTRLITKNNVEIIVPNTIMGTSQVINESSSKKDGIRIELDVTTNDDENVSKIKTLLVNAAKNSSRIYQDKEIKAMMIGFADNMLQFRVQCWIKDPEDKGSSKGELMENIYYQFKDAGIDLTINRYQNIQLLHENAQEIRITEFPQTDTSINIKEIPNIFGTKDIKKMTKVSKVPTKVDYQRDIDEK
jgi:small-conductance mechanosensitive channel